jgi:hypothetical protein
MLVNPLPYSFASILLLTLVGTAVFGQNMSVNTNGAKPEPSAILDLASSTPVDQMICLDARNALVRLEYN